MKGIKLLFTLFILLVGIVSFTSAYTGEKDTAQWTYYETTPDGTKYYININSIQAKNNDNEIWADVKALAPNKDYYAVFNNIFYSSGWFKVTGMKIYHVGTLEEVLSDQRADEPKKPKPNTFQEKISKDLFNQLKVKRQKENEEKQAKQKAYEQQINQKNQLTPKQENKKPTSSTSNGLNGILFVFGALALIAFIFRRNIEEKMSIHKNCIIFLVTFTVLSLIIVSSSPTYPLRYHGSGDFINEIAWASGAIIAALLFAIILLFILEVLYRILKSIMK